MRYIFIPITLPLIFFLLVIGYPTTMHAQVPTTAKNSLFEELLKKIIASKGMEGAIVSAYVLPLHGKAPVAAWQEETALATASTLKAITTATGLLLLGNDFRFETRLEYDGKLSETGVLAGNLYIRGGGDPTLGKEDLAGLFREWVAAVKQAGIKKINGMVVADARFFDHQPTPPTWAWEDMGNYYGAGPSGLSIYENLYRLFFKTGTYKGSKTTIMGMEPKVPGLKFYNDITTGKPGSGDNGYIYGAPFTYDRFLRGTLPPNYPSFMIKGSMPDPAYFAAYELTRQLEASGVPISEGGITFRMMDIKAHPPYQSIWKKSSPTLAAISKRTNFKSVNLYAETILRMLGKAMKGEGSNEAGTETMHEFWEAEGIDLTSAYFADGSGLSRYNAVSAKTMAEILQHAFLQDTTGAFLASLPVVGKSGTVRSLCQGRKSAGRIHAKSGYINRVRGYTGLAKTLKGEQLVFAILVNNYHKDYQLLTRDFEALMDALVGM